MSAWQVGRKPCECGHAKSKHANSKGRCLSWVAVERNSGGSINFDTKEHCPCQCYVNTIETRILPRLRALPL